LFLFLFGFLFCNVFLVISFFTSYYAVAETVFPGKREEPCFALGNLFCAQKYFEAPKFFLGR